MGQHEQSIETDKRLRYESPDWWDETSEAAFPRRWAVPLILGAVAYALYRVVQTNVLNPSGAGLLSSSQRSAISLADAAFMAALVPVAFWTSRRFPIVAPRRARHVAIHAVVGLLGAIAWIAGLVAVADLVTGVAQADFYIPGYLNWLTANLFAYAALVGALHAMLLERRLRRRHLQALRLHAQLSTARLEALKAQLHPHFLFNTLHTISELIHSDPDAADTMVVRLADLLRLSIDTSVQHEILLQRELTVLESYVELHRMRFRERLEVIVDVDRHLLDALVPPLLLQPLVENSLRHGLAPRRAAGTVRIAAAARGSRLTLTVSDDGVGIARDFVEGVGLRNTRTRLRELYDDDFAFVIFAMPSGGTEARIDLPLHRDQGHEAASLAPSTVPLDHR
ncbi:MAG: sensor histidine kinase [Gemmatimonadaceae bacterium]